MLAVCLHHTKIWCAFKRRPHGSGVEMDKYSRRSVLRGSLGLAAATAVSRPYIANAAATTATVWVNQGFVKAEDEAFKQLAADYMKTSGNTLDYSIMPFLAQNQKTVSALTS